MNIIKLLWLITKFKKDLKEINKLSKRCFPKFNNCEWLEMPLLHLLIILHSLFQPIQVLIQSTLNQFFILLLKLFNILQSLLQLIILQSSFQITILQLLFQPIIFQLLQKLLTIILSTSQWFLVIMVLLQLPIQLNQFHLIPLPLMKWKRLLLKSSMALSQLWQNLQSNQLHTYLQLKWLQLHQSLYIMLKFFQPQWSTESKPSTHPKETTSTMEPSSRRVKPFKSTETSQAIMKSTASLTLEPLFSVDLWSDRPSNQNILNK